MAPFRKARQLIKRAKNARLSSKEKNNCICYLSKAISMMEKIDISGDPIYLCEAYYLRALSYQEEEACHKVASFRKEIFEDVKKALDLVKDQDKLLASLDNITILLYNILDLLQMKGFMKLFKDAVRLVIRLFTLTKKFPQKKWLPLLWESRRLNHALCVSPVDEAFMDLLPKKINSWTRCLEENKLAKLGFRQSFSFLFLSSINTLSDHAEFSNFIIDEVCKSIPFGIELTSMETIVAGYILLDLSKTLVSIGRLQEALRHANQAEELVKRVLYQKFKIAQKEDGPYFCELVPSIAREIFLVDSTSRNFGKNYLSPWKVMECILEIYLQEAIIHEMVGNRDEARTYIKMGEDLSHSLDFPLFMVAFSSVSGKMFVELGECNPAIVKFDYVSSILKDSEEKLGCTKCISILKATVAEYLGDLCQTQNRVTSDFVVDANVSYENALEKLDCYTWKNLCPNPNDIRITRSASNCSITCGFPEMGCWLCLACELRRTNFLSDFIDVKWEFSRRQLSMEVHTRLVKCFVYMDQLDEASKNIIGCISELFCRNPFSLRSTYISKDLFNHVVSTEIPGDVFTVQRAEIIYHTCWYCLKYYNSKFTSKFWKIFCDPSSIGFDDLASWLTVAFVLSREVPAIFQKVSKLLALMYVVSSSSKKVSLLSLSKGLGENYWSSYFHQASIGTHFTHQLHSRLIERFKGPCVAGSSTIREDTFNSLGLVPKATADLTNYVKKFLVGIQSTTIISISFVGSEYISLIRQWPLPYCVPKHVKACLLVSRLSFGTEPFVMLLPLDSISQDEGRGDLSTGSDSDLPLDNFRVVDDIVPSFRTIVEEISSSFHYTKEESKNLLESNIKKKKWFSDLNRRIANLLRKLEDSWLGPWNCLLLGERLDRGPFGHVLGKLMRDLESKLELNVNEDLLKVILGGSKDISEGKTVASQLCSKKHCYVAKVGYVDKYQPWSRLSSREAYLDADKLKQHASKLLADAFDLLEGDDREPVVLVMGYEEQMLPWESFPKIKKQETYRMPSVFSIIAAAIDNRNEPVGRDLVPFRSINPLDCFYLLDPEPDLEPDPDNDIDDGLLAIDYEEELAKHLHFKGWARCKPTVQEMASALEKHDMFLYCGHGSGDEYIPWSKIERKGKCAAGCLMGCESGLLFQRGSYAPEGTVLSYLLAGSPVVVGNLWSVSDNDESLFTRAMFLELAEEIKDAQQDDVLAAEGRAKRKNNCVLKHRFGAFMAHAREACQFPFFTGAAAICYGVPTAIRYKRSLESSPPNKRRKFHS